MMAIEKVTLVLAWVLACVLGFSVLFTCGCAHRRAAEYGARLEICLLQAETCEAYVACRAAVAAEYHREYVGTCTHNDLDGGADAPR
jgi:hypothetical protein